MEHLTFEDYKKFGGKSALQDFPLLLLDCETYLGKITNNRLTELDSRAKRLIVLIIDSVLVPASTLDGRISSYSDGIESISYNTEDFTEKAVYSKISALCVQYLDDDMLYRGIVR